jgi:hypothetical protein
VGRAGHLQLSLTKKYYDGKQQLLDHSLSPLPLITSLLTQTPQGNTKKPNRTSVIMSGSIPTTTSVSESAVIDAPFSAVWHLIKLQDFSKFWSKLEKSDWVKDASSETDVVQWTFKDGQVLEVKQEEHSVSSRPCRSPEQEAPEQEANMDGRASTTSSPTPSSRPSLS